MSALAIIGCAQVVTVRGPGDVGIIPDGALLARDGLIERVGTRREVEPWIPADGTVVDAGGRILMPGFVDAHTHPVFAGDRADEFEKRAAGATYQEIAAEGGGIRSTVRRTREAAEDQLVAAAQKHAQWFLRCGATTIEAKSGYGLSLEDELKILRAMRGLSPLRHVPTFLGAHEVPEEYRGRGQQYVDLVVHEMLPRVAQERLAEYCDVFCEPGIFSPEQAQQILDAARRLGMGLRIHADQLSLNGGAELAARLGAATADHLEHTGAAGIAALRRAGVQPVLLPGAVHALGSKRYPDARDMIEAGLEVVLATDFNPGSSPTPSIPMILSLACTQMKMTPAEAIAAVTLSAARSLGRAHQIGSLEPGKRADLVIHDCADYRELAYWFGIEPAHTVYIDGRLAFRR